LPPKAELTQEKVLTAAFELVREKGFEALTARSVAQSLKCSTQPIYSLYANIEELKNSIYDKAGEFARDCMNEYQDSANSPALNFAIGFLYFAKNEKQLFRILYLSGHKKYDPRTDLFLGEELTTSYMRHSKRLSGISAAQLKSLFLKLTVYMVGIGTLLNTHTLELEIKEATEMIREMYEMLLHKEGLSY